jgi:hypothetical protein
MVEFLGTRELMHKPTFKGVEFDTFSLLCYFAVSKKYMKILVTGAAGFIAYHLVKHLVQEADNELMGLDNINTYYDPDLKYAGFEKPVSRKTI